MSGSDMSAGEEMLRDQINRIIARTELRVEQQSIRASACTPYGRDAKTARSELALTLIGLAKLKTLSEQFSVLGLGISRTPAG